MRFFENIRTLFEIVDNWEEEVISSFVEQKTFFSALTLNINLKKNQRNEIV